MAWSRSWRQAKWIPGSAYVDGSLESDQPAWLLIVRKGRQKMEVAAGPMITRPLALMLADRLNSMDVERWDAFFDLELRHILRGAWG